MKTNLLLLLFVALTGLGLGCRKKADTSTKPDGAAPVAVDANLTDQQKNIQGITDSPTLYICNDFAPDVFLRNGTDLCQNALLFS